MKPKKPHIGEIIIYWTVRNDEILKFPGIVLNIHHDNVIDLIAFRHDSGQSIFLGNVKYNTEIEDTPLTGTWTYINMVPEKEPESPLIAKKKEKEK
jgi:hypothetical protein